MTDVIRGGRQEPLLPGVTARPWSPVHEECYREIEQAEAALAEALALLRPIAALTEDSGPHGLIDYEQGSCFFCSEAKGEHLAACTWLRARAFLARHSGEGP